MIDWINRKIPNPKKFARITIATSGFLISLSSAHTVIFGPHFYCWEYFMLFAGIGFVFNTMMSKTINRIKSEYSITIPWFQKKSSTSQFRIDFSTFKKKETIDR